MAKNREPHLKAERIQRKLTNHEITDRLATVPDWKLTDDGQAITRTYELPDFRGAIAFVNSVADLAQAQDHHPDIDIRYSKVTLVLTTHSEGGLTGKDLNLAKLIDEIASPAMQRRQRP